MNRSISTGMWLARKLCTTVEATTVAEAVTVAKTGQPGNPIRLYHEAIGFGSDRRKLGEDVKPVHYKGENVKKNELEKCNKELRKHGKHQQALEVTPISTSIPPSPFIFCFILPRNFQLQAM
ncbi:hypothetical protein FF1_025737 [Malus domestica]